MGRVQRPVIVARPGPAGYVDLHRLAIGEIDEQQCFEERKLQWHA